LVAAGAPWSPSLSHPLDRAKIRLRAHRAIARNLTFQRNYPAADHFPPVERPGAPVTDIRDTVRPLRTVAA
jgi:hypothetical protein